MLRRDVLAAAGFGLAAFPVVAQAPQPVIDPFHAQRDWAGSTPVRDPDPDIIAVDSRFRSYVVNSQLQRLHTGTLWSEGPACRLGQAFVWREGQGGANYVAV